MFKAKDKFIYSDKIWLHRIFFIKKVIKDRMDSILVISLFALTFSFVALIIQILNHLLTKRKTFPTIEVKVYRLPPYKSENEDSFILIKNIGTSIAYNIVANIRFSYTEKVVKLDFEEGYFLSMNESSKNRKKLPEPSTIERFYIEIEMEFSNNRKGSKTTTYTEKIYSDEYIIISDNR